jgi:predicted transcriptional regulator
MPLGSDSISLEIDILEGTIELGLSPTEAAM